MKAEPVSVRQEIRQAKPFRSPAEELTVALIRTAELMRTTLASAIEPFGITQQQYNVLRILRGAHPKPLPTLEIGARMIEQTPGITRLIDRIEKKHLVTRSRGSADRRCVYCTITRKGLDLLAQIDPVVLDLAEGGVAGASGLEPGGMVAALDSLRASWREASKRPAADPTNAR